MFSGIVETQARVLAARVEGSLLRIDVERPAAFTDLHVGDSVAHNGVCLTVESFDVKIMTYALGAETLKITGWSKDHLLNRYLNVERSLRVGDRIHGHMVSGHVDATGEVVTVQDLGGSTLFEVRAPTSLLPFVWPKGSWAVNGVSLTVNAVADSVVSMCLIPETLQRTNLGKIQSGDSVNIEIDMMARGMVHYFANFQSQIPASATGRNP
jgi:riboflavin synthase